jgi:hypothetical protein
LSITRSRESGMGKFTIPYSPLIELSVNIAFVASILGMNQYIPLDRLSQSFAR